MKPLSLLLLAATMSAQTHLSPQDVAQGWVALFDGQTLYGWKSEGTAVWKVENGALVSEQGEYGWLRSDMPFADFELRIEYRQAADGRRAPDGIPHGSNQRTLPAEVAASWAEITVIESGDSTL